MLQDYIKICQKQITELQQADQKLKLYGRMLCVRTKVFQLLQMKTIVLEVLDEVKSLIKESSSDILNLVIDRAHKIGKSYNDKRNECLL